MANRIFKSDDAEKRLQNWYRHFLECIEGATHSLQVPTTFGESHVLEAGDTSKPTLIALHAMLTSSAHLVSELKPFIKQFHIVAPDIPGQSARGLPIRLPYSDDSHATWLKEIITGLEIEQPHILGVSLGGFIARQYGALNPDSVKTLSLLVPAGIVQGSLIKGFTKMALPTIRYKLFPNEENLQNMLSYLMTTHDEEWARYLGDAFNDFSPNMKIPPVASDEELRQLTMPCLVMGAEEDISFPGVKMIERAGRHIPNLETELIKQCKHCPPTTPEFRHWLYQRVTDFIGRHSNKEINES